MFVQSSKFIERHQGNINRISVYGQELNSNTWRLAQMNLAICGIEANFGDSFGDSFHDDKHPFLKADFVMANPPFNISNGEVTNSMTTHAGNTAYHPKAMLTLLGCSTCCTTWRIMGVLGLSLPTARYPHSKARKVTFAKYSQCRFGRGYYCYALAVVLQCANSLLSVVLDKEESATGQDTFH